MHFLAKQDGSKVKSYADPEINGNTSEVPVLRSKKFGNEIESGALSLGQDLRCRGWKVPFTFILNL